MKIKKKLVEYSWIFMLIFFAVTIYDYRFGVLAIICMVTPIYFALIGQGKKGCTTYCPRGSFLNILRGVSFRKDAPKWLFSSLSKIIVFSVIMVVFILGTVQAWGDLNAVGFVFLRMLIISTLIAVLLGIFYKDRTWCAICPMGSVATEIIKKQNKKKIKK